MIIIHCPKCHQEYELNESIVGCSVQCAVCDTSFVAQESNDSGDNALKINDAKKANNISTICQNCKKENKTGTSFCIFCGKKIAQSTNCPFCHATLVQGAAFCPNCGKKVNTDSENIQATESETTSPQKPIIPHRLQSCNSAAELKMKFMGMSKKKKLVVIISLLFSLLICIFLMCLVFGEPDSNNASVNQHISGRSSAEKQSEADAAALMFLMGAAAAQQQRQNTSQPPSSVSRRVLPEKSTCFKCEGQGYIMINGQPLTCGQCGGKGYIRHNDL